MNGPQGDQTATPAFHRDSLNVIAKFNERRCNGMPLYGQDLIEVLTIVSPGKHFTQYSFYHSLDWSLGIPEV